MFLFAAVGDNKCAAGSLWGKVIRKMCWLARSGRRQAAVVRRRAEPEEITMKMKLFYLASEPTKSPSGVVSFPFLGLARR